MDTRAYLKVKLKSLAAEAKIIRLETKRAKDVRLKNGLALHRIGIVRYEARHTLIAYGFLRGKPYHKIESKCKEAPDWNKVRKMIEKYGADLSWGYSWTEEYKQGMKAKLNMFLQWSGQEATV